MIKKKMLAVILCAMMVSSAAVSCGKKTELDGSSNSSESSSAEEKTPPENVDIANYTAPQKGDKIIEMDIRDYGTVKFRLFPEYADKGVENFIGLAEDGYYDGLTFHRIIQDFMIQGGDPLGDGTGGKSLWGSTFDGGTDSHLIHAAGAVAYANSNGTATNKSQFYIVTGERNIDDNLFALYSQKDFEFSDNAKAFYKESGGVPYLDGNYTVFGQVFDGLDIVFKIQYQATNAANKPFNDVVVDKVRVTEYNGEELKWKLSDYEWDDPMNQPVANFTEPEKGDEIICMNIKDYGTVKIRLFPEYLEKASENFKELAKKGYYDGLTFHRVINDFMIQGGDPKGDGTGGESAWGGQFDGGKYYNLIHAAGALAYANSGQYGNYTASDGSQFFIVTGNVVGDDELGSYSLSDNAKEVYKTAGGYPYLDGGYTVFGQVIDGLDIVFDIQKVKTDSNDKPEKDVIIESVTVEEYDGSPIRWYIGDYSGETGSGGDDKEEPSADSDENDSQAESTEAADTTSAE